MTRVLLLAALLAAVVVADGGDVRGVPKSKLHKYTVASFSCDAGAVSLPASAINDDYCDCADGSDEPGTAACAGVSGSSFYCRNVGHHGTYLPSSRVNDGICDCCDGSDEWSPASAVSCDNSCNAAAAAAREQQAAAIAEAEEGARIKAGYIERGKAAAEKAAKAVQSASEKLAAAEEELVEAKRVRDEAEAKEEEERRAFHDSWRAERAAEAAAAAAEEAELAAAADGAAADERAAAADCSAVGDDAEAAAACEKAAADAEALKAGLRGDGVDGVLPSNDAQAAATGGAGSDASSEDASVEEESPPPYTSEQASAARAALGAVQTRVDKLSQRVKDARSEVETDYGDEKEFWPLKGQCFSIRKGEYDYKMCPFGEAKQDHTSLGRMTGWKQPHRVMQWEGGSACWNGPQRSLTATLRCGVENAVLSVDEPSICTYHMEFATPAACNLLHAQVLNLDLESMEEDYAV